jgi:hypothetical protein
VAWERWLGRLPARMARLAVGTTWGALALGGVLFSLVMLPLAPINSGLWRLASQAHDNFVEEIGWPELVETVAGIYAGLPAEERAETGILAGNYGEAGAINLYGPAYALPEAISGVNSYWLRGYGPAPPTTLIVLGYSRDAAQRFFETCDRAGQITNRYGVENEEYQRDIFVCRRPRQPWPALWESLKRFG